MHLLAARLLGTGIDPGEVAHELWDRAPFGYLGLLSAVLGRARLERAAAGGFGLVWTTVTRADRAAHGLPLEAAEPVIDVVRRTDEAEVAVVLKEADDGQWQVSARSKGAANVGRACVALGGGGHARAAGFTAQRPGRRRHGRAAPAARRCPVISAEPGQPRRPAGGRPEHMALGGRPPGQTAGWSSSTSRPDGPRTTSWPGSAGWPGPAGSGMPARWTRWRPGCW